MTAAVLLAAVHAAGGRVVLLDPQRLKVVAPAPLPAALMDRLRANKPAVLAALASVEAVDDFDERAGIIGHDAGMSCVAAEVECKRSGLVAAVLPENIWQQMYRERLAYWRAPRHTPLGRDESYTEAEARRLAFAEEEHAWHRRHGELVDLGLCAGCLQPLDRTTAFHVGDGNAVHPHDDDACLIAYGARRRAAARKALLAMGLEPPPEGGSP